MQIGAVSFRPYIYNANRISAGSLSRISSVGDDLTSSRTDFSGLSEEDLNENPLKKGQTVNFGDVLNRQMWEGRRSAARIMKPEEKAENPEAVEVRKDFKPTAGTDEMLPSQSERNLFQIQRAIEAYQMNMTA